MQKFSRDKTTKDSSKLKQDFNGGVSLNTMVQGISTQTKNSTNVVQPSHPALERVGASASVETAGMQP